MRSDVQDLRYRIGDMLGEYAPDSFKRPTSRSELIIGLGSIIVAGGISFLAMRLADRRLDDLIRRVVPTYASRNMEEWPTAGKNDGRDRGSRQDSEGRRMPDAAPASMFDRSERRMKSKTDEFKTSDQQPGQSS